VSGHIEQTRVLTTTTCVLFQQRTYTMEEVAAHNTRQDVWVVLKNKVPTPPPPRVTCVHAVAASREPHVRFHITTAALALSLRRVRARGAGAHPQLEVPLQGHLTRCL
jgi:hypothetical protein